MEHLRKAIPLGSPGDCPIFSHTCRRSKPVQSRGRLLRPQAAEGGLQRSAGKGMQVPGGTTGMPLVGETMEWLKSPVEFHQKRCLRAGFEWSKKFHVFPSQMHFE